MGREGGREERERRAYLIVLRRTIIVEIETDGTDKKPLYFSIFPNNIWSYEGHATRHTTHDTYTAVGDRIRTFEISESPKLHPRIQTIDTKTSINRN